ncbi:aminotransferase class I/II-fold pyridoxal phosphate-dependent enzyme [Neorhodopirellula pilleata]|uniref:8-amino-7-oxononanoate synthase n=1 Tax=Neorhodopirellula pilleata TaxID=2714738 RepID=A0A5C6A1D0_9BACT|nr:aminotransferase class I/II-fold pyridoxal phosphate-dependent enzyme [Neorhodopirellula pilleata]TWT93120.1 8-amino-7-oxononanoate synthase [Neorhodopirellula pilleata]
MTTRNSIEKLRATLLGKTQSNAMATGASHDVAHASVAESKRLTARSLDDIPPAYFQFKDFPEYKEYTTMQWYCQKQSFPQSLFQPHAGASDANVTIHGREFVNFSTYNYLALGSDERVKNAAIEAVRTFGAGTGSGRSITGEIDLHSAFEREICDVLGTEDAVLSVGGYSTNAFTIGYLCRNQDLILYDELIHNSALIGCKMTGSRRFSFPHNDYDALTQLLDQHRGNFERVLILAEGVYSMDGDIPDVPKLVEIKDKYKALLMVDEAHSMGVIGPRGLGVCDYFGIDGKQIDILYGSLSKAFGTCGGYVAGPSPLIAILKHYAPGVLLYGASPTPANAAAALESLRIMREQPDRARRLQDNAAYFIQQAQTAGLDTYRSKDSGVVPIMMRDSELALWLSMKLWENGICSYPMMHPIVPRDKTRLRFFINVNHTHEQINQTIDLIGDLLKVAPKSKGLF